MFLAVAYGDFSAYIVRRAALCSIIFYISCLFLSIKFNLSRRKAIFVNGRGAGLRRLPAVSGF